MLAARDPEWFEKIDKLTATDMVALAEEFTKQQVAKVQHGECLVGEASHTRSHAELLYWLLHAGR